MSLRYRMPISAPSVRHRVFVSTVMLSLAISGCSKKADDDTDEWGNVATTSTTTSDTTTPEPSAINNDTLSIDPDRKVVESDWPGGEQNRAKVLELADKFWTTCFNDARNDPTNAKTHFKPCGPYSQILASNLSTLTKNNSTQFRGPLTMGDTNVKAGTADSANVSMCMKLDEDGLWDTTEDKSSKVRSLNTNINFSKDDNVWAASSFSVTRSTGQC